jgi:predicted methyltransferase
MGAVGKERVFMILLSCIQAAEMLNEFQHGSLCRASLDLGRTQTAVSLGEGFVRLSGEVRVSLDNLRVIANCEDAVFAVSEGTVEKVIRFSEATSRTYKLRPTADWPALEISGILMHRIKGTTPKRDAQAKLRLVSPVRGAVLDTCMGLGYTAILAALTADSVTVIEKDRNVLETARLNPYSQPLFEEPKIKVIHGDATEVVPSFGTAAFDIVNHDPPTLSIAGELYSDAFYAELLRILKPGGKLLHYTGAPGSRGRRVDLNASVTRRLTRVGFVKVRNDSETLCVIGSRPGRG